MGLSAADGTYVMCMGRNRMRMVPAISSAVPGSIIIGRCTDLAAVTTFGAMPKVDIMRMISILRCGTGSAIYRMVM